MRPARLVPILLMMALLAAPLYARRSKRPRRPKKPRITPLTVQVEQHTDLFEKPGKGGRFVGTLARGTRLPIIRVARGRRCKRSIWWEVATDAWMCAAHGHGSWRLPTGTPQPVLRPGRLVPRIAYYARRDGVPIFTSKEAASAGRHDRLVEKGFSFSVASWLRIGKRRFIQTRHGEYVPRGDMHRYNPSAFAGRRLSGRPARPIGCSVRHKYARVRAAPSHGARRVGKLEHHSWVEILETRGRGRRRFHRIGPERWVAATAIRKVEWSEPPQGVGAHERWVEVLLRQQTLVAYEGRRPVYATLVSTGRYQHKSPRGLFRMRTKVAMSAMRNQKGAGELYRVDDVPWIQYFHQGYALHGTYWHNSFGRTRSHGCINLAPKDAQWLFRWAPPRLRPGWMAIEATATQPGMLVRVRNSVRHQVRYRGPNRLDPAKRPSQVRK